MGTDIIYWLIVFVSTLIGVSVLGFVAGFSPTLYIAQIAISSKTTRPLAYAASLMSGVLVAVLVLIILFQTLHLDTLLNFIDTTVRAVTVSVVFNVFVGAAFVFGGIWYLSHQELPKPKPSKAKQATGMFSVFGLGFVRTFISISGVTATYFAGNIIASISTGLLERVIYTLCFFVLAIVPFAAIVTAMQKNPKRLLAATHRLQTLLRRFNYRLVVGVGAIILGGSIVFFNIMMALFY